MQKDNNNTSDTEDRPQREKQFPTAPDWSEQQWFELWLRFARRRCEAATCG